MIIKQLMTDDEIIQFVKGNDFNIDGNTVLLSYSSSGLEINYSPDSFDCYPIPVAKWLERCNLPADTFHIEREAKINWRELPVDTPLTYGTYEPSDYKVLYFKRYHPTRGIITFAEGRTSLSDDGREETYSPLNIEIHPSITIKEEWLVNEL